MTKLEEEIAAAMFGNHEGITGISEEMSKAAAEVAKRYIEKAYRDAVLWRERYEGPQGSNDYEEDSAQAKNEWLKENGITE